MSKAKSQPKISQPVEFGDEDDRPAKYGVMAGATVTPAKHLTVEQVIADIANTTWGEIRDVHPLDREHATRVIAASYRRLLECASGGGGAIATELAATKRVASKLLKVLLDAVRKKNSDGPFAVCSVCEARMREHTATCPVGMVAKTCEEMKIAASAR